MNKKYLVYILTLFMTSCGSTNESLESMFKHREEVTLENVAFINNNDLLSPENIAVKDSLCIVYEPQGEKLLTVFDLKNKTKRNEILPQGKGPGEAISLQTILFDSQEDVFYSNDIAQNKMNVFSTIHFTLLEQKNIDFPFATFAKDMDNWIFSITGQSQPFIYSNSKEEEIRFGSPIKMSYTDASIVTQVMQGPITVRTTPSKRLAWFSVYGEVLQIYNFDNANDIKMTKESIVNLPIFDENGAIGMDTKLGINSVSSSENYIFALYTNNYLRDALTLKNEIFNSRKILVYDWDGLPKILLELDKEVLAIAYNEADDSIYCIGFEDNKDYGIFTLNDIEKRIGKLISK